MSEDTNIATTDTPKAKKPRARKTEVTLTSVYAKVAARKGIDTTRAAKLTRSYMRSNFDTLLKEWPALRNAQKQNRDGNRYPQTVPTALADKLVTRALARKP